MIKSFNQIYHSRDDLVRLRSKVADVPSGRSLIQVFCGVVEFDVIRVLQQELVEFFPGATVVGLTTSGEILGNWSTSRSILINLTQFDKSDVKSLLIDFNEAPDVVATTMAKELSTDSLKALILFSCSISDNSLNNGERLIRALGEQFGETLICGAMAGEDGEAGITYVFTEDKISSRGCLVAALAGESLTVGNAYNLGWVPIGKRLTITRAEGARVYTIEDKLPSEIYAYYLGQDIADKLPMSAIDFPLMIERDGLQMAVYMTDLNADGSVNYVLDLSAGEQIRFGICQADLLTQGVKKLYREISQFEPQALFAYSCISRKWNFGEDIGVELSAFNNYPFTAGSFGYGEFFKPHRQAGRLFSQSLTLLLLSEEDSEVDRSQQASEIEDLELGESRQFRAMRVLHRLVDIATQESEAMHSDLIRIASRDFLTGLANRRLFDETLEKEFVRHKRSHLPLSLILIDIDLFKSYNDTYGHVSGDDCLRAIGNALLKSVKRSCDLVARYGGEEFGCILPLTEYRIAMSLADELRINLENLKIPHKNSPIAPVVTASFGVLTIDVDESAGLSFSNLIEACDSYLYQAKEAGRNRVEGGRLRRRSD